MSILRLAGTTISNLFSRPATLMYPYKPAKVFEKSRGKITIDISLCIYCGICQKKCPTDAINVDKAAKKWQIDRIKCISCGACAEACPKKCLFMKNTGNGTFTAAEKSSSVEAFTGA